MEKIPDYIPNRGVVIVSFTAEQVATHNVHSLGDKRIEIVDRFSPDEYSIEEATVMNVSNVQKNLLPGDQILVDYAVFSTGRYDSKERYREESSRLIYRNNETYLYWCYDDMHPNNSSEVLGFVDDKGKASAFGDAVLIYPPEKNNSAIEIAASVEAIHEFPNAIWVKCYASPVPDIKPGEYILCEDYTVKIKFRGIELHYINLGFIYGVQELSYPYGVKLF